MKFNKKVEENTIKRGARRGVQVINLMQVPACYEVGVHSYVTLGGTLYGVRGGGGRGLSTDASQPENSAR